VITFAGPCIEAEHNSGDVMTAMEVGPDHMPTFVYTLSLAEMQAVANYVTQQLAVIPLSGGDIAEGGRVFRRECAPCHRTAARGGALVFAGTNAPDIASLSPALIAGAIRWGPGPMPAFPPSVLSDKQVASIVDYVKYIQHPPSPGGNPMKWLGPVSEGFAAWVVLFAVVGIVGWIEKGERG
jgi:ubiquinol-cytochrome c reductase cytochrome c subunit